MAGVTQCFLKRYDKWRDNVLVFACAIFLARCNPVVLVSVLLPHMLFDVIPLQETNKGRLELCCNNDLACIRQGAAELRNQDKESFFMPLIL
jgi:hypothetical protein